MKTDFEQIKRTTDIVRVVESYGVKLKKVGRNHVGRCCFHADKNPSLIVTPDKGLFHCPACGAAGNVIQFVAKKEGISEREAAIKLLGSVPGVKVAARVASPPLPAPQLSPGEAAKLLQRVAAFYARTLHKDRAGLDYLKGRKLDDPAMLEVFQVGYANGTLPGVLPKSGEIIDGLKALGVLNAKGQEHFRGCVTVPIFDSQGNVAGIYGRRITAVEPHHLYLPGPHRGVFNGIAARTNQTLLIVEAILDAMSLWQAGFKNVIALYGANGWTADHETLLRENGTTEIYLCLDNDEAGRAGTERLKVEILPPLVKQIHVVQWPEGAKDAADFFLSREPKDFETLVKAVAPDTATAPVSELTAAAGEEKIEMTPDGFAASYGVRRYELRAIERPNAARLRASVKAVHEGRFHIDMVDFYLSRSRRVFIGEAARLFRETAEIIEADVNRLIGQLEAYAQKQLAGAISQVVLVNDAEKAEALKLGRHADLAGEILRDMERLGMIGEATNKLMGYLVMTSRKMDDPLALLILSGSGAGKSHLQDTILSLCPDEELIKLTSLSGQALFYKGEDSLKNKVLAVEEVAGAEGAYYAIRNLISAKKLTIETTVKNALTGQLTTQVNTVHGPTAVFQTTTNPQIDAETRSRFILVSVDESPEQTRAILEAQRQNHTLEGWKRRRQREAILRRHHALQRMLKPVRVVNPFEPLLSYPDDRLLVRRDHPKYLHLILAVTFLHQLQRTARHDECIGDYIETTLDDVAIANDVAHRLFGHSLDDLSQPGRDLLELIGDYVRHHPAAAKEGFTRRELREALKWGDTRLRTHLDELVQMEYLTPLCGRFGQAFHYKLLYDPDQQNETGRFLAGLKSVEQLRREANLAGILPNLAGQNGHLAPTSQVEKREVLSEVEPHEHRAKPLSTPNLAPFSGEHISVLRKNGGNGSRVSVTAGGRP
jgi:DNA primase catalytic core